MNVDAPSAIHEQAFRDILRVLDVLTYALASDDEATMLDGVILVWSIAVYALNGHYQSLEERGLTGR
jgi:hypothetical protein